MEDPWADSAPSTKPDSSSSQAAESQTPGATPSTVPSASTPTRASRMTPRRLVAQPTRLQAVEDDPLGPLGATTVSSDAALPSLAPPVPPIKEQLPLRTTLPAAAGSARRQGPPDPHRIDDDDLLYGGAHSAGPRQPPPVQPAQPSPIRSSTQPSVSVEQAAKPNFQITVGDPHKVGDLTSSHIVYSVRTKVRAWTQETDRAYTGELTGTDHVQRLQAARVRGQAAVPRLPVAVHDVARQQPGRGGAAAARQAGGGAVREQLCRGAARGAREDAQQDGRAPDAAARLGPQAVPRERRLQRRRQAQGAQGAQPGREQERAQLVWHQCGERQQVCRAGRCE